MVPAGRFGKVVIFIILPCLLPSFYHVIYIVFTRLRKHILGRAVLRQRGGASPDAAARAADPAPADAGSTATPLLASDALTAVLDPDPLHWPTLAAYGKPLHTRKAWFAWTNATEEANDDGESAAPAPPQLCSVDLHNLVHHGRGIPAPRTNQGQALRRRRVRPGAKRSFSSAFCATR